MLIWFHTCCIGSMPAYLCCSACVAVVAVCIMSIQVYVSTADMVQYMLQRVYVYVFVMQYVCRGVFQLPHLRIHIRVDSWYGSIHTAVCLRPHICVAVCMLQCVCCSVYVAVCFTVTCVSVNTCSDCWYVSIYVAVSVIWISIFSCRYNSIWVCTYLCGSVCGAACCSESYGVATISRFFKMTELFCKRAL